MTASDAERILLIGPAWVGDMVMTHALLQVIKTKQPQARITVLAPDWSLPILSRMPEVDTAIAAPFRHGELNLRGRWQLARRLGSHDRAIVIPNSLKSALIPWFAGIPRRVGWRGELRYGLLTDCRPLDPTAYPRMVQRLVALALPADAPPPQDTPRPRLQADPADIQTTLRTLGLTRGARVLALCPGAEYGAAKQWPAAQAAAFVTAARTDGWQVWLIGSPNDSAIATDIHQRVPESLRGGCIDLTGRTRLEQAIDLLAAVDVVVSNDSGLMHIAAALDRPVVALYGSTSPDFTPPLTDRVKLLSIELDCRPCFQRECPLGHLRCLTELSADRVYQQLNDLLAA